MSVAERAAELFPEICQGIQCPVDLLCELPAARRLPDAGKPRERTILHDIRFMKFLAFPLLGLLATATAHAQIKLGSVSPLLFESTITTEKTPTSTPQPGGAVRKTYTTTAVRFINRDILEAMRVGSLLDGTLQGWTLARVAGVNGVGNIYALKNGKTAVAVPATLLTQPVNQGTATTGNEIVPATGASKPNLTRRAYATLNVRAGASSAAGTQTLKFANVKSGTTVTVVPTQVENFSITGKSGTGVGIVSGSYRTKGASVGNIIAFFPAATTP